MININERNIKLWSTIGPRATLGLILLEISKEFNDLMVLTADVSTSAGLDRFRKTYPDKYLDVGIAEQNMIGIASGLASEKFRVLTTTFAPFQTQRCCEQIKVNLGYMKQGVCMVGIASGLVLGNLGYTHCSIEDIGTLRSIPNLTIVSPADCLETVKSVYNAIKLKKPCYIRLTGGANCPIIYTKDYNLEFGKSVKLKEGKDITIFCCGSMVNLGLKTEKILKQNKISSNVINMHTIKPIDKEAIRKASNSKLIVSIEEHNIIGGLGSAIAEYNSTLTNSPRQLFFGVNDSYTQSGSYKFLLEKHGLNPEKIAKNILNNLKY